MSQNKSSPSPSFIPFQVHVVSSTQKSKSQDSPTSSILKTPTAIFVSTRSSSSKTRKLKFANGPVDLETSYRQRREGSQDSASSASSSVAGDIKQNNGGIDSEGNYVEVAISPVKRMKVSPESWTAFQEYKKYNDYANETEKTDYTYSRLSKFRHKEIIPGFPIRPNLSRSPLTRSTNASKSYNFSYASDSYIRSTIIDKAGLRHRARQLYLGSEDEADISTTQPYEPYERLHVRTYKTITRSLVAIYTSIVYYIALSTSSIKNLFSKYVLRRDYSHYRFVPKSPSGPAFWIPWSPEGKYTSPIYLSGTSSSYFYSFRSALYRLYERVTTFVHVSSQNSIEFVKVKYSKTPRRSKILWFLIPLLLLAGLQIARSDYSFPKPDAILNLAYNSVTSIPSFLYHFATVSTPNFFIKTIPYYLSAVPYFFTDSLPYFFTNTIPYAFSSTFHYISNISFFGVISNFISNIYNGFKYYLTTAAESGFNFIAYYLSAGYTYSSNVLILFYSYFCTQVFDLITGLVNGLSYLYNSTFYGLSYSFNVFQSGIIYLYNGLLSGIIYSYEALISGIIYSYNGLVNFSGSAYEVFVDSIKWAAGLVVNTVDSVYSSVTQFFGDEITESGKEDVNASFAKKTE